jgi:hypothetical protein
LNQAPEQAFPAAFSEVVARLTFIRHLKLDPKVHEQVHPNRLRQLAHETKRLSAWRLGRFDDLQRRAMLVAFLLEMSATLTDQAVEMHDRLVGKMFKRSENQQARQFLQEAKVINKNINTYVRVGKALIAAKDDGSDPYEAITAIPPWSHFVDSIAPCLNCGMGCSRAIFGWRRAGNIGTWRAISCLTQPGRRCVRPRLFPSRSK